MEKYIIEKDNNEIERKSRNWNSDELYAKYCAELQSYPIFLAAFDDLKSAEEFFESAKADCHSRYMQGEHRQLVIYDLLMLHMITFENPEDYNDDTHDFDQYKSWDTDYYIPEPIDYEQK